MNFFKTVVLPTIISIIISSIFYLLSSVTKINEINNGINLIIFSAIMTIVTILFICFFLRKDIKAVLPVENISISDINVMKDIDKLEDGIKHHIFKQTGMNDKDTNKPLNGLIEHLMKKEGDMLKKLKSYSYSNHITWDDNEKKFKSINENVNARKELEEIRDKKYKNIVILAICAAISSLSSIVFSLFINIYIGTFILIIFHVLSYYIFKNIIHYIKICNELELDF